MESADLSLTVPETTRERVVNQVIMQHPSPTNPLINKGPVMSTRFEDLKFMFLLSAVTLLGSGLDIILR